MNQSNRFGQLLVADTVTLSGALLSRIVVFVDPAGTALVKKTDFVTKHTTMTLPGATIEIVSGDGLSGEVRVKTAPGPTWVGTLTPGARLGTGDVDTLCLITEAVAPSVRHQVDSLRDFVAAQNRGPVAPDTSGTQWLVKTQWASGPCNQATMEAALAIGAAVAACAEGGPYACIAGLEVAAYAYQRELDACL